LPSGGTGSYTTRHGFGYSLFQHREDGIDTELTLYVAIDAPVKYVVLKLRNRSGRPRRLSITGYLEWVLGDERAKTAMHISTEIDAGNNAVLARNPYNTDFSGRTAFFAVDATPGASFSGDRANFLGRNGTLAAPAAMGRARLGGGTGTALDPCAAIRVPCDLAEGGDREIIFRLGAAVDKPAAQQLLRDSAGRDAARTALAAVKRYWRHAVDAVRIETPDPSMDLLANGWLVYQALASRLWARNAFYQSSGAFGFRDQLQDVMALVHCEPALAREHLLRCAGRQFPEGDVQHWWHPPSGRGLRSRCSDDYLWLPLATCRYVRATGDMGVLSETAHFLEGRPVSATEDSYYDLPAQSGHASTLYEHCVLAIEHGLRRGVHGLPLMGSGDWNDGMNRVGIGGKGESVWLGFFLYSVLTQFGELAVQRGDGEFATRCANEASRLRDALEDVAWDGGWYRRAWFDDGSPLGTSGNAECRIDSIAQSWAVLSGAAPPERARLAMHAVDQILVHRDSALIQLLDPPFDHSDPNPGYIQGYVRGVRENGGQYTHAAVWVAMAFAALGDGNRAWELCQLINPINHARSPDAIERYKAEPYVMAGDVYSLAPHVGRGGWTWYTGSAGWMLQLILESILGVTRRGAQLCLAPCVPAHWKSFHVRYRFGSTHYDIAVSMNAASHAKPELVVDGVDVPGSAIGMVDDGKQHAVEFRAPRTAGASPDASGEEPI
jgi:cellobiose phosphorylase